MKKLLIGILCSAVAFSITKAEQITFKNTEVSFSDGKKHEIDKASSTCDNLYSVCRDTNYVYYLDRNPHKIIATKRDTNIKILSDYYNFIKQHKFDAAFALRGTSYNFESFKKNYATLKNVLLYNIKKTAKDTYSFFVEMSDTKGTTTYFLTKKITNGKLYDIGGTKKITPDYPSEFTFGTIGNVAFKKEKKLFINISPIGDWLCNFRNTKQYKDKKLPSCTKLSKFQMVQATVYTIIPKNLPSFVLFEDLTAGYDPTFTIDAGATVVVLPNTLKVSADVAKGLSQDGAA